jgi:AI-2 transport protein TqsA
MSARNLSYFFIIAIASVFILWIGKDFLIPLVFALFLWFIMKNIKLIINRIPLFGKWLPEWVKNIFSFLVILIVINFVINLVYVNFKMLANSIEDYTNKFDTIIQNLNNKFNVDVMATLIVYYEEIDLKSFFLSLFNYSTGIIGTIFIVFVYTIFVILEEPSFRSKLRKVFPQNYDFDETFKLLKKVDLSIAKYLGLKTLICLLTGALSYLALLLTGVDFPIFWAFIIFLFNYIPILGSYIATFIPFVFSLLQFGSFGPALLVLFSIGTIQVVIGNFIDPKLMSNHVNLSPLVIILSLSFWGAIWGIIGMFLSVPLMIILVIAFSKIPRLRPIAIMMSKDGNLD